MKHKVEAFDIWMYLQYITNYEPLIRCRIDFAGQLDVDVLKKSITASLKVIPILGCTFQGEGSQPRWTERGFTGEDMVHVVSVSDDDHETISQYLSVRINIEEEPLLKVFVIRKPVGDTLCVTISHLICDASGFKTYLYLLSDCYTKIISRVPFSLPALGTRSLKPLFSGIRLGERLQILRTRYDAYESFHNSDQEGISHPNSEKNEAYMEFRVIPADSFSRLKDFANVNDATINDALMSLFARAFCREKGMEKMLLPSTIDLRKFLPAGHAPGITNYSNNCMCGIIIRDGDSMTDTIRQISDQMKEHKSNKNVLKSMLRWNTLVRMLPFKRLKLEFGKIIAEPVISYTNLGILDKEHLRFASKFVNNAYMTAAIRPRPYLQLTASTWDDHCTLCCNIYGCEEDRAVVCRILDNIDMELRLLKV